MFACGMCCPESASTNSAFLLLFSRHNSILVTGKQCNTAQHIMSLTSCVHVMYNVYDVFLYNICSVCMYVCMHVYVCILGLCDNGKIYISIMPIMHYKIISITIVIAIKL